MRFPPLFSGVLLMAAVACGAPQIPISIVTPTVPSPTARTERQPSPSPTAPAPTPRPSPAPTATAVQRLEQAERASGQRNFDQAAQRYGEVAQTQDFSGLGARESHRLRAYARFQEGLMVLLAGQEDGARAIFQVALRDQPDEAFAELGFSFWDAYALAGDIAAACQRARGLAQQRDVRVSVPGGTRLGPERVCPV